MTTWELRRYSVKPEMFERFVDWYFAGIPAIRARFGFTVEWVAIDRERLEFDWLVSHPGTETEFRAAEAACHGSAEFLAHRATLPSSLTEQRNSLVEVRVP